MFGTRLCSYRDALILQYCLDCLDGIPIDWSIGSIERVGEGVDVELHPDLCDVYGCDAEARNGAGHCGGDRDLLPGTLCLDGWRRT